MPKLIFLVIFSAAITIIHAAEGPPPQPPITTSSTTTVAPIITTTVTPPTPPTSPPTTPSTTPSTTSVAPTTAPPEPPTTAPPAPPTTAPPAPPTTPAPEPPKPVDPSEGTWNVTSSDNTTCIRIQFALQVQIPYHHTSLNKTVNATVDIPNNALVNGGSCDKEDQSIHLQWLNQDNVTDSLTLNFVQNATAKNYILKDISLNITPDATFPGIEKKDAITLTHKFEEFKTNLLKSYKCDKLQELNLTDSADALRGYISVSHLQMQAFANSTDNSFYSAEDCAPFDTPDVVPIAVGCALAALVIIVLVAYLIGRRRRQARGYLSM